MTPHEGRTYRQSPVRVPEKIPPWAGKRGLQQGAGGRVPRQGDGTAAGRQPLALCICSDATGYFYAARQSEIRATVAQLTGRISKIAAATKGLLKSYEDKEG